jgi:hypothetical protein
MARLLWIIALALLGTSAVAGATLADGGLQYDGHLTAEAGLTPSKRVANG